MSALGHKRTCAMQKAMSALPPIATLIAFFRHAWFGPQADISRLFDHFSARSAGKGWLPKHHDRSSASPSDHLSLESEQSEQQDYPERTGISL
jgi:hypothetical protein